MKTIHITTGDINGIGLEISLKALKELGPQKGIQFILWRADDGNKELLRLTNGVFHRINLKETTPQLIKKTEKENILLDRAGPPTPTDWVVKAAKECLKNKDSSALVTGPLSKVQMQKEGFSEKGHTDLLKKITQKEDIFMTFLGEFFNVVLLTGHIPLKEIKWSEKSLNKCIELCFELKEKFIQRKAFPPALSFHRGWAEKSSLLAVLGLNPHSGEEGLLGTEEIPLKKELEKWKSRVEGPLVPDTAFLKNHRQKYFMYLCLYHDQALIPFKMIHERKSFQLSLGLPFVRTSVSHGTAKDIVGQDKADAESMKQALLWAIHSLSARNENNRRGGKGGGGT